MRALAVCLVFVAAACDREPAAAPHDLAIDQSVPDLAPDDLAVAWPDFPLRPDQATGWPNIDWAGHAALCVDLGGSCVDPFEPVGTCLGAVPDPIQNDPDPFSNGYLYCSFHTNSTEGAGCCFVAPQPCMQMGGSCWLGWCLAGTHDVDAGCRPMTHCCHP